MARVGEIKALVAKRKIRDSVFANSEGEPVPVVKGGVFDFGLHQLAVGVRDKDVGYFAPMTLVESNGERVFRRAPLVESLVWELADDRVAPR